MVRRLWLVLAPAALALGCDAPLEAPLPAGQAAAPALAVQGPGADPAAAEAAPGPEALAWTSAPVPFPLDQISGTSALRMYGGGPQGAAVYDGVGWTAIPLEFQVAAASIWSPSTDVVYALPYCGMVERFERGQWSAVGPIWQSSTDPADDEPLCWFYWSVWGLSETEIYLAGEFGQVARYDGATWSDISPDPFVLTDELLGVWAASASDVFVVGGDHWGNGAATIVHYDGADWTVMMASGSAIAPLLTAVWGASPTDVFAVGRQGTILHYDGTGWTLMESGTTATLTSISGTSGSNVYAAGFEGLLHYDGTGWSSVDTGTEGALRSVQVVPRGDVFALGTGVLVKGLLP